jgi:hypothetical protein
MLEAGGEEHLRQFFSQAIAGGLGLEAGMKGIDTGDRDQPDVMVQKLLDDGWCEKIPGGLDDQFDASVSGVPVPKDIQRRIQDGLSYRIEQHFAPRKDDASGLLPVPSPGKWVFTVQIRDARREVAEDAAKIRSALIRYGSEIRVIVRTKLVFVAVDAGPMAEPGRNIIDRFHGENWAAASLYLEER